jgi:hypothetical protein
LSRTPIIDCEKFGSLNRNNQESLNNIATDPAKVMRVTIKGIIHNKLHIFPDATSQKAHILKRYFPQIMSLISDILVKRSKVGQGK